LCQNKERVERRHGRKTEDGRECKKERRELGGGCLEGGRAPELDPAVQVRNEE
jgi:hypothetical protein